MGDFARLADLFTEGDVLALGTGDKAVTVWITKLSPFEIEEARQDGRVAKARVTLAATEIGSPEYDLFKAGVSGLGDQEIITELLAAQHTQWLATAVRAARQDPAWAEKSEVLEQSDATTVRGEELALLEKISREFAEHIDALVEDSRKDERALLEGASREQLETKYREQYLEDRGLRAFQLEYQRTEVYHALRSCKAAQHTTNGEAAAGEWNHVECDHNRRVCESRAQIASMPMGLWQAVRDAIDRLNMPLDIARFSAAPESSSASSEQPSEAAEASSASTPEVTPAEPVGIS